MVFDLPEEHEALRATVREFAVREVAPVAGELDRTKAFPYEIVRKLGELGWMGIPFPHEWGGAGADTLAYVLAVEELARVDASHSITISAHTTLGTSPIVNFGTAEQKRRYVPPLASGREVSASPSARATNRTASPPSHSDAPARWAMSRAIPATGPLPVPE